MELKEIELKMNEMCDLLGISAQGIRLYEKHGVLHSFKYEGNGYRYYYFEDIAPAIQVRNLRKFGMPLAECSTGHSGQKIEELEDSLTVCRQKLEENICYEQALLKAIDEMAKAAKWAVSHLHEFKECMRPAMYYLLCEKDNGLLNDRASRKLIRSWSEQFPFVHFCPQAPVKDMGEGIVSKIGFCLFEKDEGFAPEQKHEQVSYIPEELCIGGTIRVGSKAEDYFSIIEPGLRYMEQEGYEITGDIYSVLVAADIQMDNDVFDYYYIWYPCKKC